MDIIYKVSKREKGPRKEKGEGRGWGREEERSEHRGKPWSYITSGIITAVIKILSVRIK